MKLRRKEKKRLKRLAKESKKNEKKEKEKKAKKKETNRLVAKRAIMNIRICRSRKYGTFRKL